MDRIMLAIVILAANAMACIAEEQTHRIEAAVPNSSSYDVFASLRSNPPGPFNHPLNTAPLTGTTFDHFPGTGNGEVLYYFVRGRVDGFPTRFGGPDTGYTQVASIPVAATDGTDPQGIKLTWDPTPWKTPGLHAVYQIYRGTDADLSHATVIAGVEGTFVNNYPAGGKLQIRRNLLKRPLWGSVGRCCR